MAASVSSWLDSVKKGYGAKFAACFEDNGAEDVDDVAKIRGEALAALKEGLVQAGAKPLNVQYTMCRLRMRVCTSSQSNQTR